MKLRLKKKKKKLRFCLQNIPSSKEKIYSHKIFPVSASLPKFPVMNPLKLHRVCMVITDNFNNRHKLHFTLPVLIPISSKT